MNMERKVSFINSLAPEARSKVSTLLCISFIINLLWTFYYNEIIASRFHVDNHTGEIFVAGCEEFKKGFNCLDHEAQKTFDLLYMVKI